METDGLCWQDNVICSADLTSDSNVPRVTRITEGRELAGFRIVYSEHCVTRARYFLIETQR